MGAWIETCSQLYLLQSVQSRTFTGAWIETNIRSPLHCKSNVAPLRVRGLKQLSDIRKKLDKRRTFTGAWIETIVRYPKEVRQASHLYGCVD